MKRIKSSILYGSNDTILQKIDSDINKFLQASGLKFLNFRVFLSVISKKNCCENFISILVYQKKDFELGKIRFCCDQKFQKEVARVKTQLDKSRRSKDEIYLSSYNSIRGRVGHIIFQALLGANERKYVRESEFIKENSIVRNVHYWLESCSPEEWDDSISKFQRDPSKKNIMRIICLYSPLYRNDNLLVEKMACEILYYLSNLPIQWKSQKIRIVYNHLGMSNVIVGDTLVEFKFTEKKIGLQKSHFEQIYRRYRSVCKLNEQEKEFIRNFCIFSPISMEIREISIRDAIYRWNLKEEFQTNFSLWQMNNYISISKAKRKPDSRSISWEDKFNLIKGFKEDSNSN